MIGHNQRKAEMRRKVRRIGGEEKEMVEWWESRAKEGRKGEKGWSGETGPKVSKIREYNK